MQFDFHTFVGMLWERKPSIIIFFVAALIIFVLLAIDACRFGKRRVRGGSERRTSSDFRSQLLPCPIGIASLERIARSALPRTATAGFRGEG